MLHPIHAHLSASAASITDPFQFLASVSKWFKDFASSFVDSPEERQKIEDSIMRVYDDITRGLLATNPAIAAVFVALRKFVLSGIDHLLLLFTPSPAAPPAVVNHVPSGSAG
jgi:hypothetical protein